MDSFEIDPVITIHVAQKRHKERTDIDEHPFVKVRQVTVIARVSISTPGHLIRLS